MQRIVADFLREKEISDNFLKTSVKISKLCETGELYIHKSKIENDKVDISIYHRYTPGNNTRNKNIFPMPVDVFKSSCSNWFSFIESIKYYYEKYYKLELNNDLLRRFIDCKPIEKGNTVWFILDGIA